MTHCATVNIVLTYDVNDGGDDEHDVDDDEEESVNLDVEDNGGEDGGDGEEELQDVPDSHSGPAGLTVGLGGPAGSVGQAGHGVAAGPHHGPAVQHLTTQAAHRPHQEECGGDEMCGCQEDQRVLTCDTW